MTQVHKALTGLLLATATSASALAQTSPAAAPDSAVLQEIVVTAQRRVENLQQVPIAATALDTQQLQAKAVTQLADLQTAVPSLSITNAGQTQSINIRGIGLASNSPSATAGVATYVDGLFQPPIVQFNSFYDLANVEVLRGPQGTLVGTNSTGGAIFINSKSPRLDDRSGYLQAGYGNFNNYSAEGALGLPVTDTLAVRVAGFVRDHSSYYTDVGPYHNDAGRLDEKGGRIGLLFQPGSFSALAKVQYNDMETGGYAYRPIPGTYFASYAVGNQFTLSYDTPTRHREQALISSLELKQVFSNDITLRSLSGYQDKTINSRDDVDGSQAPAAVGGQETWNYYADEKQYSEELDLLSPTTGVFNWILGAYFQRNLIDVRILENNAGFPTDVFPGNKRTTTGFFVQGNYKLTDKFELQLGGRYSHYKADGTGGVFIGSGIPGFPPSGLEVSDLSGSHTDSVFTGKVDLNYQMDQDNLFYVFAARGYKPGGFNSVTSQFSPETVWDYEGGWKSTLANGHVRTQVSAFYNNYSNFQFDILDPTTGQAGVRNVANATIKGLEVQMEGRFGGLQFDGGAAYVDSHLDGGIPFINTRQLPPGTLGPQCPPGTPASPPLCFDYTPFTRVTTGGPNLYSPTWSYNLGAQYAFALRDGKTTLTPRLNYAYVGQRYSYIAYSSLSDRLPAFGLLSALVTLGLDNWHVDLYGTNLADKRYVSGQASASNNEFYGPPREFGIRAGVRF